MKYSKFKAIKEQFAFDMSDLTAYTDQTSQDLIFASLFDGKTGDYMTKMTGVKYKKALNIATNTLYLQNGACGFTSTGGTALTQRDLTVADIMVNMSWCLKDFNDYWAQVLLNAGSYQDTLDPVEAIAADLVGQVKELNEVMYWRGNTALVNPNLNKFDGFIKIIDAASPVTGNTTSATSITASNADTILNAMYAAAPDEIKMKPDLFYAVGIDTFTTILDSFYQNNSYANSINTTEAMATGTLIHPIYGVRIEAFAGLTGTNRIFLGRQSNFYIGTDLESDLESFRLWYSQDNRDTRFSAEYKAGVQIAFGGEIVQYTNA